MSSAGVRNAVRLRVREEAKDRCGYCLSPQPYVMGKLEVEHIVPKANGGSDDLSNLWLSCSLCNRYKGPRTSSIDPVSSVQVELFNPRCQVWSQHFRWSPEGTHILGLTPTGRATVEALRLNSELAVEVRRNWILAGWHPPKK